MDLKNEC